MIISPHLNRIRIHAHYRILAHSRIRARAHEPLARAITGGAGRTAIIFLASIFFAFISTTQVFAAAKSHHAYILPDDGFKDASFNAFRTKLLTSVHNHDRAFMEGILSPNIQTALGGGTGKKSFLENWDQLTPTSSFWGRMERALTHGAQFDRDSSEYHAPALSFEDSHSDLPQGIVWRKNAPVHKSPDQSSPVSRNVYNEQLTISDPPDGAPVTKKWIKVLMRDGTAGFMKSEDVYSAYDEFAVFKKEHHRWCLTWFGFAGL